MHALSHLSYPYLFVNGIALLLGKTIPLEYNLILIFFSVFPDIDVALDFIRQFFTTGKYVVPPNHHDLPTHWPIVYAPLLLLAIITFDPFFIIAAGAIYLHLAMDMLYCNEGVMFFYPFSKKWHNFFSEKTKHKPGIQWNHAYNKLKIATVDKFAFLFLLAHITFIFIL